MEEGVLILDSRGRIQQHNLALSKLTRRAEQSVGKRPLEIIMSNELQSLCDQVLRPMNPDDEGHPKRLSITMGDDRTYDVTVVRSQFLDGRMGAIIVFHDVTELRRLERVRQDFVANVSHELRTPLTSVKGYVETLIEDENLDKNTAAAFVRVIKNNTDHMVKMIDDLLQLARLQARGSTSQRIPVDASEALAAAWKTCEPLAAEKKLRLVSHLPEEGVFIVAEPGRMMQIFRNLLENAIRYSPENAEITVGCTPHGRESLFSIQDDGPGIPWQHQQRVFERFYRVEKERSSRSGSTGLGLAICRHIILNHGGRIWVQSPNSGRPNGTTMFFTLERPSGEGSEPSGESVAGSPA
jgi:two-component system, OmpR family, phosphate regulon sensor histidine kinase PhoR